MLAGCTLVDYTAPMAGKYDNAGVVVKNFTLAGPNHDKLQFDDLFGGAPGGQAQLDSLLGSGSWDGAKHEFHADNGQVSVTVNWGDTNSALLTVTDGTHSQNVLLEGIAQPALGIGHEAADIAQMLQEIIKVGGS